MAWLFHTVTLILGKRVFTPALPRACYQLQMVLAYLNKDQRWPLARSDGIESNFVAALSSSSSSRGLAPEQKSVCPVSNQSEKPYLQPRLSDYLKSYPSLFSATFQRSLSDVA